MTSHPPIFVSGQGTDLVLIHGSASSSDGWMGLFSSLSSHHRLVAYDRAGAPRHPIPPGERPMTIASWVDELERVVEAETRGPVDVYGSSFGGIVGLEFARRRPERVRGLIVGEPPLPASDDEPPVSAGFYEELVRRHRADPMDAGRFFLQEVLEPETLANLPPVLIEKAASHHEGILADSRALLHYRVGYDRLPEVRTPILLVGGRRSLPHYGRALRALGEALPDAELCWLADAGHLVHSAPSFRAALAEFVRRLDEA
jgi:pimeloyl-ACP methyl ester carboxylesterase